MHCAHVKWNRFCLMKKSCWPSGLDDVNKCLICVILLHTRRIRLPINHLIKTPWSTYFWLIVTPSWHFLAIRSDYTESCFRRFSLHVLWEYFSLYICHMQNVYTIIYAIHRKFFFFWGGGSQLSGRTHDDWHFDLFVTFDYINNNSKNQK